MKRKNIKESMKEYFFVNPTARLRVRQIERELKLPLPSVIGYAKELEKEEILTKSKIGDVVFYTPDKTSKEFLLEKRFFNLKQIYYSGLVDFLIEGLSNPPIVVFGSYAKGEDTEKSDIDIYLETSSKKEVSLEKFEKILKRKIQIFRHKGIHEIKNSHLANNIINGVILNGMVEVFK